MRTWIPEDHVKFKCDSSSADLGWDLRFCTSHQQTGDGAADRTRKQQRLTGYFLSLWTRGGNLFAANGHLDVYSIILRPNKSINLKISRLDLVKHLINTPLIPWQDQTK